MDDIKISPSLENYLETILFLQDSSDKVRVTDLADSVKVSKASVHKAIKQLTELNLANHNHYGSISLTSEGLEYAKSIEARHNILCDFFINTLGVSPEIGEDEACSVEHLLSMSTVLKMKELMDRLK